jgi:hypothetical protein
MEMPAIFGDINTYILIVLLVSNASLRLTIVVDCYSMLDSYVISGTFCRATDKDLSMPTQSSRVC